MKKLWKVRVNNYGWDYPVAYYFESRKEAESFAKKHPAYDDVKYAGRFTDEKADYLTGKIDQFEL